MTIKDLKNMMIVETRNHERYLVVDDMLLTNNGYNYLRDYNDNLMSDDDDDDHEYDIMAVYTTDQWGAGLDYILSNYPLNLVWEREEDLLTSKEKEYLKVLIDPITQHIKYITKECNYIKIVLNDDDNILLCDVDNMKLKFLNLIRNKKYTIKELKLND